MARIVSLTILTTLIVFLGITFFQVIAPFLLPLFLAGVTAVLCQPIYRYFKRKTTKHPRIAAALTTVAVLAIVLVPLLVGTFIGSVQLYTLAQRKIGSPAWNQSVKSIREELKIDRITERLKSYVEPLLDKDTKPEDKTKPEAVTEAKDATKVAESPKAKDETETEAATKVTEATEATDETEPKGEPKAEEVDELQSQIETNVRNTLIALAQRSLGLATGAIGMLGNVVSVVIGLLMFAIALYYFLADGPVLLAATQKLIPVQVDYQRQLLAQFDKVVRAVVMATFVAALVQGLATAIALFLCDFRHFFIIFIVATLASLIPLAGTWLVWGPCAIWLFYVGSWGAATFLTLFGIFVIGTLDNVVRTYILQSDAKLHPLLAFVSVLGGLQVMGLWGVFIGPIVACFLHALVKIFNTELQELSKERFGQITAQPPPTESDAAGPKSEAVTEKSDETTPPAGKKRPGRSRRRRRPRRSKRPNDTHP